MKNWAIAGVFVLCVTSTTSVSARAVTQGADCSSRDAASIASHERAATQNAESFLAQLTLAACYDKAWRFHDVEPALARAATILLVEFGNWVPKPGPTPIAGEDVPAPRQIRSKPADYPEAAQRKGISGVVILELQVSATGEVKSARAVKPIPELNDAAIRAARSWRFEPTTVGGKPTEVQGYAAVRFGQTVEATSADHMEMAGFYYQRGLFRLVRNALEAALSKAREDRERFGSWISLSTRPPGAFTSPVKIRHVPPRYPENALATRTEGRVTIEALLDRSGHIGRARVISTPSILDAAAMQAVLQWEFTPATRDGTPVSVALTTLVDFRVR